MSFYFPRISSGCEIDKYKQIAKEQLAESLEVLRLLVSWEETYIREMPSFKFGIKDGQWVMLLDDSKQVAEHKALYDAVKAFVEDH